jgi:hypothetical protein
MPINERYWSDLIFLVMLRTGLTYEQVLNLPICILQEVIRDSL